MSRCPPRRTCRRDPLAIWTVGFTTSGSGALSSGNVVAVTFPSGFSVTSAFATPGTGFSGTGCGSSTTSTADSSQVVELVLGSSGTGCSLAANTAATITILGIERDRNAVPRAGFSVGTYTTTGFGAGTVIDTTATPSGGGTCENNGTTYFGNSCDILAGVLYAPVTSSGAPS